MAKKSPRRLIWSIKAYFAAIEPLVGNAAPPASDMAALVDQFMAVAGCGISEGIGSMESDGEGMA